MRRFFIPIFGVASLVLATTSAEAKFILFSVPDARGTNPTSINAHDDIAGFCVLGGLNNGFVRTSDGTITDFNVQERSQTFARDINSSRTVAGVYFDEDNGAEHGFLRTSDGTITSFDVPSAFDTDVDAINNGGVIAGYWKDSQGTYHGFQRAADGTISVFDAPGSTSTKAYAVNANGEIAGNYVNSNSTPYGFIRHTDGAFTKFGIHKAASILVRGLNASAEVTGTYYTAKGIGFGFLRDESGTITEWKLGSAGEALDINADGEVVGQIGSAKKTKKYGFLRTSDGQLTRIDVPQGSSTYAVGINDSGKITGGYLDKTSFFQGYLVK